MLDLTNKSALEKANLKSAEIAKLKKIPKVFRKDFEIEVTSIGTTLGGVECLVKAWKDGKQIGFGDGTVEIERFRVFNPPIWVADNNGSIVENWINHDGQVVQRKFREDYQEALLQVLEQNLSVIKTFDDSKIIKGKVGSTVDTFYGFADTTTTERSGVSETWAQIIAGAGTGSPPRSISSYCSGNGSSFSDNDRHHIFFDTSTIGTDAISAAVLSIYGNWKNSAVDLNHNIYQSTVVSDSTIAASDYQSFGTTAFTTDIASSAWNTSGYNDLTLNASGIANINKSGISKFGFHISSTPASVVTTDTGVQGYPSSTAGTTQDPKLVVTHTPAPTTVVKDLIQPGIIAFAR